MPKTRSDLIARTLQVLGVSSVGQAPTSDDYNAVDSYVDPLMHRLYAEKLIYIGNTDNIEDAYFGQLADILAYEMRDTFALGPDEVQKLAMSEAAARNSLRIINQHGPSYEVLRAQYF